jgi:uncharacterized glyoxalase superfamily protein PhnB
MKTHLLTLLLTLATTLAFGHGGVEIGPNGGRILEFSKNETMHGEVTVKGSTFHIAVLDKDMKPVAIDSQTLTATTGDRDNPTKLQVTKDATGFIVPAVKAGDWLIVQFKLSPDTKAITARMEYNTSNCGECSSPEWLCKCKKAE